MILNHLAEMSRVDFSSDEKMLLIDSNNETVNLFTIQEKKQIMEMAHHSAIDFIEFSSGKTQMLLLGYVDGEVHIVDIHTGKQLLRVHHTAPIMRVLFTQTGKMVFILYQDGVIHGSDILTEKSSFHLEQAAEINYLNSVKTMLLIGYTDGTVRLFAISQQKLLLELHHSTKIDSLIFSLDRTKMLLIGFTSKTVEGWDIVTGKQFIHLQLEAQFKDVRFSSDQKTVIIQSANGIELLFDCTTGKQLEGEQVVTQLT